MDNLVVLPENYNSIKYGINFRFVTEEDASFIIKLRTDDTLSRYIHSTPNDVNKQIDWIREYKKKERLGLEYYFVFYKDGMPFGVNRLYHMSEKGKFTSGSWICLPDAKIEDVVASSLIPRIIAFEMLNKEIEFGVEGCHEDNKKVIKFNKMIGLKIKGYRMEGNNKFYTFNLLKEDFYTNKIKIEKLLNMNE
ncbi:MAG: hypothetical protein PHV76_03565 [Bacteroidales bacterium]|nr:hypothetical protein [Bacteroidales bacterium]